MFAKGARFDTGNSQVKSPGSGPAGLGLDWRVNDAKAVRVVELVARSEVVVVDPVHLKEVGQMDILGPYQA